MSRRNAPRTTPFFVLLLLLAGACDDTGTTAKRALAERFVGQSITETGAPAGPELEAVLAGQDWDAALFAAARERGGIRWESQVTYTATGPGTGTEGGRMAKLVVDATLDLRADGAFHSRVRQRYETPEGWTGETGREAYWLDRLLYTKLANDPFFVRRSLDREHERWRAAPVDAVGGLLTALAPLVTVEPRPDDAGRFLIEPAPVPPEPPAATPEARAALRDRDDTWPLWLASLYRADRAAGELRLAADGRTVESVRLSFGGRSRDDEDLVVLTIEAEGSLKPLPPDAAKWSPPEDATSPVRDRTHARIQRILKPFRDGSSE